MASGVAETGVKSRVEVSRSRKTFKRFFVEIALAMAILAVFGMKIYSYANPEAFRLSAVIGEATRAARNAASVVSNLPVLNSCPARLEMHDVSGGYVCGIDGDRSRYAEIFKSYPLVGTGREVVYASLDEGTINAANDLMRGMFDMPRYRQIAFPRTLTWSEDPYSSNYWRFQFYSLRPTLNLMYAFRMTGKVAYAKRLIDLDLSFISAEPRSTWAWKDPHAVAFRCMSLVDTWWKLRQAHVLGERASDVMLREVEKTGAFLADPNHYQGAENHGTNEAAALLNLAVAFPTLPNAHKWLLLAEQRLEWQLKGMIDSSGQLIENSPYYDFYILSKLWQIYQYLIAQRQPVPGGFETRLRSMVNFATYILQPNSQVPMLGSSLEQTIHDYGVYSEMAAMDPHFLYVLTHGDRGVRPPVDSRYFRGSMLTVMRSGWDGGDRYPESTYLTFNIGRYRTAHSQLDALAFTLYGGGGDLLPSPGLYTYAPGPYRRYFHGTESHNTVTVDGKSQFQGIGQAGKLVRKDGITYQSAESSLYPGVQHRRLVMLLDSSHILVVDQLHSRTVHSYRQMFHLFPSAELRRSGLTVSGVGRHVRREVTIRQLQPQGLSVTTVINRRGRHPAGLCSKKYGRLESCYEVSYLKRGRDAAFETLLTIGRPQDRGFAIRPTAGGRRLAIADEGRHLTVTLAHSRAVPLRSWATDPETPPVQLVRSKSWSRPGDWDASGGRVTSGSGDSPIVSLTPDGAIAAAMRNDAVRLDLSGQDARFGLRVKNLPNVGELTLTLSNDHWAETATTNLLNSYKRDLANQWTRIFLAPAPKYGAEGGWVINGKAFDWSKIDGVRINLDMRGAAGPMPVVNLGTLTSVPPQGEGKVVVVFDDGSRSILPAAAYMHKRGMPGNIAVIGKYVDYLTLGYLNAFQLRDLQNRWGWDMVNHSQQHVDAVQQYFGKHDLTGYVDDIVQQARWLEAQHLNSAPNWFIYPNGATNTTLERVVGQYYMFALGVSDGPDGYPFGNREDVANFEVKYPGDGEVNTTGFTRPNQIAAAVRFAKRYHTTLILTFHRIHSEPSDLPGYPLSLFKRIIDGIRRAGIKVMTLSQLDRSDGVPVKNRIYSTGNKRALITVKISE